jgi:3',5'-cyclic AMP phosphodiesterase CpdA
MVRPARILHLSDPHFSRLQYDKGAEECFFDCLGRIDPKPDLLIISGDFAFNGEKSSYRKAAAFIQRTRSQIGIAEDRFVHVVPGNHDFQRPHYLFSPRWSLRHFTRELGHFFRRGETQFFSEFNLSLWCADSSVFSWKQRLFDLATGRHEKLMVAGRVGKSQLRHLAAHFTQLRKQSGGPPLSDARRRLASVKIAVVHHHPLPVPVVGDRLLGVLEDAGDLLSCLGECDFDLVLHGHQHFPYVAQVKYFGHPVEGGATAGDLIVSAAGTVTANDTGLAKVNHFSVVDVDARNPARPIVSFTSYGNAYGKYASGGPPMKLTVERLTRADPMQHTESVEMIARAIGYKRRYFRAELAMQPDGGAVIRYRTLIHSTLERLREVHNRLVSEVDVQRTVRFRALRKDCDSLTHSDQPDRLGNYYVTFEPYLARDQEAEFEYQIDLKPGSFFVTQEALMKERGTSNDPFFKGTLRDYDGLIVNIGIPSDRLEMDIDLNGIDVADVMAVAFQDNAGTLLPDERARLGGLLQHSGAHWFFGADAPLLGARYGIAWKLKTAAGVTDHGGDK